MGIHAEGRVYSEKEAGDGPTCVMGQQICRRSAGFGQTLRRRAAGRRTMTQERRPLGGDCEIMQRRAADFGQML